MVTWCFELTRDVPGRRFFTSATEVKDMALVGVGQTHIPNGSESSRDDVKLAAVPQNADERSQSSTSTRRTDSAMR